MPTPHLVVPSLAVTELTGVVVDALCANLSLPLSFLSYVLSTSSLLLA
jgi:hypothetical protein